MNNRIVITLIVVIVLWACNCSFGQKILELTGEYNVPPLSSPSQQSHITITDPSERLIIDRAGQFNISLNKTIPDDYLNIDLILFFGRINEAAQAYWNDSLVGTCGSLSPLFRVENWKNSLFYIPSVINNSSEVKMSFIVENNSVRGGFYRRVPHIMKLHDFLEKNSYEPYDPEQDEWESVLEGNIKELSNANILSFNQLKLKNEYELFGEFPHTFQIYPLGMKENDRKVQYLYQIELDYHASKRIFVEELCYMDDKLANDPFLAMRDYYRSDLLSEERVFGVYLPPDYYINKDKKYPVIYAFGGGSEIYATFLQGRLLQTYNDLIDSNHVEPFILIGVQGSRGSSFLIEPLTSKNLEESFIDELIPYVEKKYRIQENTRGIIGLSKGGTPAMSIGLRYADTFKAVVSVSGVLNRPGTNLIEKNPFHIISNSQQKIKQNIFITCGNSDELGLNTVAEEFHTLLQTRGIEHKYILFEGGHHHNEWFQMIPEIFAFFQTHF